MHGELSFYIHLHASGSTAAAGWKRKREEDADAQCDSLCSAASTVSSLSMLLCDGRHSSVSSSRRVFLMGVRPARRQLWRQAQRPAIPGGPAAQPPLRQGAAGGQGQLAAVQGSRVVVVFNNEWLWPVWTKILSTLEAHTCILPGFRFVSRTCHEALRVVPSPNGLPASRFQICEKSETGREMHFQSKPNRHISSRSKKFCTGGAKM